MSPRIPGCFAERARSSGVRGFTVDKSMMIPLFPVALAIGPIGLLASLVGFA